MDTVSKVPISKEAFSDWVFRFKNSESPKRMGEAFCLEFEIKSDPCLFYMATWKRSEAHILARYVTV